MKRTVTLGSVCRVINGRAYKKEELLREGSTPVLRVGNFFTSDKWYFSDLALEADKYCDTGDLLYAWSASFGPRIWDGGRVIYHYHIWKMEPDEAIVDRRWLYFWLLWDTEQIKKAHGVGATMLHVTKGAMEQRPLSIPALTEQQRIVAILDEAFEGIAKATANAERNLANTRELFDASLKTYISAASQNAPLRTLAQISKQFGRGKSKHRPRNDPSLYGGPYPFIQTGDVRNAGHYITTYSQTYSEAGLRQSKLWPSGTICITIAANIAETGILTFDACFPDSVIGVVVEEQLANQDYVEFLLQYFKVQLKAEGKGSAQDNINMGTFENALFPFPELGVQDEIAGRLNFLDEQSRTLVASYEAKLRALSELKQALLHQAFSGHLTGKEAIAA